MFLTFKDRVVSYLAQQAVQVLDLVIAQPQGLQARHPGAVHREGEEAVAV